MQIRVPPIAAKKKLDLFWSPRHHLPLLLPACVNTVVTIHDIAHRLFPGTMAWPNLMIEKLLMGPSLKRADGVIAVSNSTATAIADHYPISSEKIFTVHSGGPILPEINRQDSELDLKLPKHYFLFVGTLDPRKNLARVLNAFKQIEPRVHDVHLVIVGGQGWKNKEFYRRLNTSEIKDRVVMTGYVSRSQLRRIYEKAVCLLFPSLYEGFGFPILEAMACGTPVITSQRASMPEVAGDAALLVDPNDAAAIAEAMLELLSRPELQKKMAAKGFKRLEAFCWEKCARQTLEIIERSCSI
jgi:glycosyltransferase involved in cell wall biosynthesis